VTIATKAKQRSYEKGCPLMAKTTSIAWTDHTFNIVWGCTKVSPGCAHCYAERDAKRYGHDCFGPDKSRRLLSDNYWHKPLKWAKAARKVGERRRVFVGTHCDVFENHATVAAEREKLWALIRTTPELDWLLLTKRISEYSIVLPPDWGNGYANVWLGVSVENNEYSWRAQVLGGIPAAIRFISCEPALGWMDRVPLRNIDWVIYGGESGPNFRSHNVQWARDMRKRCRAAGVAFFYKQSPALRPGQGVELDGEIVREGPR
jgi:protein gp37